MLQKICECEETPGEESEVEVEIKEIEERAKQEYPLTEEGESRRETKTVQKKNSGKGGGKGNNRLYCEILNKNETDKIRRK